MPLSSSTKTKLTPEEKERNAVQAFMNFYSPTTPSSLDSTLTQIFEAEFQHLHVYELLQKTPLIKTPSVEDSAQVQRYYTVFHEKADQQMKILPFLLEHAADSAQRPLFNRPDVAIYYSSTAVQYALTPAYVGTDIDAFLALHDYIVSHVAKTETDLISKDIKATFAKLIAHKIVEKWVESIVGKANYHIGNYTYKNKSKTDKGKSGKINKIKEVVAGYVLPYIDLFLDPASREQGYSQMQATITALCSAKHLAGDEKGMESTGIGNVGIPRCHFKFKQDELPRPDHPLRKVLAPLWNAKELDAPHFVSNNNNASSGLPVINEKITLFLSSTHIGSATDIAENIVTELRAKNNLFEKYAVINDIDRVFYFYRHFAAKDFEKCTIDKVREAANHQRIRAIEEAIVKQIEGTKSLLSKHKNKDLNWKDAVLGLTPVYNNKWEMKIKAKSEHVKAGHSIKDTIDTKRFVKFADSKPKKLYGGIMSTYSGQHTKNADTHVLEDACFSTSYMLGEQCKITFNVMNSGPGLDNLANARASYHAGKTAERLIRAIATELQFEGKLTKENLVNALTENNKKLYYAINESTLIKQQQRPLSPSEHTQYEYGSTSLLISAVVESHNNAPFYIAYGGGGMFAQYNAQTKEVTTLLRAKMYQRPEGLTPLRVSYDMKDLPEVTSGPVQKGDIHLLFTAGMWRGLPVQYRINAPLEWVKEHNPGIICSEEEQEKGIPVLVNTEAEALSLLEIKAKAGHSDLSFHVELDTGTLKAMMSALGLQKKQFDKIASPEDIVQALTAVTVRTMEEKRVKDVARNETSNKGGNCSIIAAAFSPGKQAFAKTALTGPEIIA